MLKLTDDEETSSPATSTFAAALPGHRENMLKHRGRWSAQNSCCACEPYTGWHHHALDCPASTSRNVRAGHISAICRCRAEHVGAPVAGWPPRIGRTEDNSTLLLEYEAFHHGSAQCQPVHRLTNTAKATWVMIERYGFASSSRIPR